MKKTMTYILAALAVLNLIWLFVFDYRLPSFRLPSDGEGVFQSAKEALQPEEEEISGEAAVTEEADPQEKEADVSAPLSQPSDLAEKEPQTEAEEENVQKTAFEPGEGERICFVGAGNAPNLRSGPGMEYAVVDTAYENEALIVTGPEENEWFPIRNSKGVEGYVFASLVILQD